MLYLVKIGNDYANVEIGNDNANVEIKNDDMNIKIENDDKNVRIENNDANVLIGNDYANILIGNDDKNVDNDRNGNLILVEIYYDKEQMHLKKLGLNVFFHYGIIKNRTRDKRLLYTYLKLSDY
ncbi:hypothetical protein RclHR1_01180021 [Rhizophagus clarus]|uniref:Uncharacterized protein n=1 Tax=Rhizophagus clarus TaxID=94130 RepID=A0A2Z6QKF6_9GLOM|nr:hypothetical protein RclHR1_01180021 [Rhizophagus clarus]